MVPTQIKLVSDENSKVEQLLLDWDDGHQGVIALRTLRDNCPCASCVEEFTGRRRIAVGSIPCTLERLSIEAVGNYALHFSWSDGHGTGIYTFDYLRKLCPCPQCLPEGLKEPPEGAPRPGAFEV